MPGVATPFRVVRAGREITARYLPIDVMMAEKSLGKVQDQPVSMSFFCAYNALKRAGEVEEGMHFEDFVASLEDYEENPSPNGSAAAAPGGATPSEPSPTRQASHPES